MGGDTSNKQLCASIRNNPKHGNWKGYKHTKKHFLENNFAWIIGINGVMFFNSLLNEIKNLHC